MRDASIGRPYLSIQMSPNVRPKDRRNPPRTLAFSYSPEGWGSRIGFHLKAKHLYGIGFVV